MRVTVMFLVGVVLVALQASSSMAAAGKVVDAETGKGVAGAQVSDGSQVVSTDAGGRFELPAPSHEITVRAIGYDRISLSWHPPQPIALPQFLPKALYLSMYGATSAQIRQKALELIDRTELNAVVIDVKGDRGMVSPALHVPQAQEVGAQKHSILRELKAIVADLKERGIYAIARIVVFKDGMLVASRPDLAVRKDGRVWKDRERQGWADPFQREVWEYNIAVAVAAARIGFDEIQFDYVRFPDSRGLVFSRPNNEKNRVQAISGFLEAARAKLKPFNVFLSADVFGYVCWNYDDTLIGQRLEELARHLDYISPMLYPSGFQFGIPGYRHPVRNSRQIVLLSLKKARQRTGIPPVRFRPWLQAFRDYAFDRRSFGAAEIRSQIDAAQEFGSDGWMLWNPRNAYSAGGVKGEDDD